MRPIATLVSCALAATSVACGRGAGPNEDEVGKEIVWEIIPSRRTEEHCADEGVMASHVPEMEKFENDGLVYYFIYSADPGLKAATMADCPQPITSWDDCRPGTQKVPVAAHTLSFGEDDGSQEVVSGCTMSWKHAFKLVDEGHTGSYVETISFQLTGDATACRKFDDDMKSQSTTGKGVNGCTAAINQGLLFVLTKDW